MPHKENYVLVEVSETTVEVFARPLVAACYSFGGSTIAPYSYGFHWSWKLVLS